MKRQVDDLAIFGGPPAFPDALHVGRPNIGNRARLHARIDEMLDRRCLTNGGPFVQEFEAKIAALTGAEHCIAVANGTIALAVMARACGLTGEVIMPAFTFVATAHALHWQGVRPVFCDVDESTHNIDPDAVESLITDRTTGILAVHLWGRPAAVEALQHIAERHHLRLVYDAAHAIGSSAGGAGIGAWGDASMLSFHATKLLNTFEGGAIITNEAMLASEARRLINFGFVGYDHSAGPGINGKMSEASALMGVTGLESLDEFIKVNTENLDRYHARLGDLPALLPARYAPDARSGRQYVIYELLPGTGISRDQLVKVLVSEGVLARRYFYPGCHRTEPYLSADPVGAISSPISDRLASRVFALPTGTSIDGSTVDEVASVLRFVIEHADEVAARVGPVSAHDVYTEAR